MNQEIEIKIAEKKSFEAVPSGSVFKIPTFKVIPNVGLEKQERTILLPIVRGSRYVDNREYLPVEGTTHETLIAVIMQDLEQKNEILPCVENSRVLEHLQAALDIIEDRQRDRYSRNVLTTNQL
jgi:hypothetical protein